MSKIFAIAFACLFLSMQLPVHALDLPAGLSIEPPESLDLTYQVVPAYDEKAKVIARWDGEQLQYLVNVSKLPPGYLDAKSYLGRLERDVQKAWSALVVGRQSTYTARNGLTGTVVEFSKPGKADTPALTLVTHFITDGKSSYIATASPIGRTPITQVFDETVRILESATTITPISDTGRAPSSEDEMLGIWTSEDSLPDGRRISSRVELNADLSFKTTAAVNGTTFFTATGVWSRNAGNIHWIYIYANPELPADKREDDDQLLSITASSMTLKSALSNKERIFTRVQNSAP